MGLFSVISHHKRCHLNPKIVFENHTTQIRRIYILAPMAQKSPINADISHIKPDSTQADYSAVCASRRLMN
jgi:hypothetical protein